MIIQCEECRTKFDIDETFIKDVGSKVKCSRCKHVFVAYPPKPIDSEDQQTVIVSEEELVPEEESFDAGLEEMDFDGVFEEESMEDIEDLEAEYGDDLVGFVEEADMKMSFGEDSEEMREEASIEEIETIKAVSGKKKSSKFRILLIFAVIVLGLIGAAYGLTKWMPDLFPDFLTLPTKIPGEKQTSADMGASRLEILTTDYSFVETEKAGRLFVIRGKVRNGYSNSRSFILITGAILDVRGEVIKEKSAYAGNAFREEELRMMPLDEINRAMKNPQGIDMKNINVKPGTTVDFAIAFENPPEDNMSEFTVGAVSSSPGSS